MNAMRKSFMVGLTVLGMAATSMAAHAQDGKPQGGNMQPGQHQEHRDHKPDPARMQEKMGEFFAMQQARVHYQLKLTAGQEPADRKSVV